jgi:purine-binding chemotaxis protein CheW
VQALLVTVHDAQYAIELTRVREIVRAPVTTPIPGAPESHEGVFNFHGEVVPLFDLAMLLGLPRAPSGDLVTVAETSDGPAGLRSHGPPELVELDDDHPRAGLLDIDFLLAEPAP